MTTIKRVLSLVLSLVMFLVFASCTESDSRAKLLNKEKPVTVSIWHYYNGTQKQMFDECIKEFNSTIGADKGIIVTAQAHGDVNELTEKVTASANGEYGAEDMPDVFAAYADTAYDINKRGLAVDLHKYFTDEELSEYVQSYLDEGNLDNSGKLVLFPIAKSTEVLVLNKTDWQKFAQATGASEEDLASWEGITRLSKSYYEYCGKSFFGRDAFANYMIIGSLQLGHELFSVDGDNVTFNADKAVMKKLWENYYVPYINGWFSTYGRFRSDDIKTGTIIAMVGSTSSVTYFPSNVTRNDGSTYPIEYAVYPLPGFDGCDSMAVQQGAGMLITKSDEKTEYAASLFLKWFTKQEQNVSFSVKSGYLPVKTGVLTQEVLGAAMDTQSDKNPIVEDTLKVGIKMVDTYKLYTNKAFDNGYEARNVVDTSMDELAKNNRDKIEKLIADGISEEDAVARYDTQEVFEAWYTDMTAQLNATQNK